MGPASSSSGRGSTLRILDGRYDVEIALLPRIKLTSAAGELPFSLTRLQFPVRLAFGISINKAQGQSVLHVGIDLHMPVFTDGQLYIALSRARSVGNVKGLLPTATISTADSMTTNIVFPEVLSRT